MLGMNNNNKETMFINSSIINNTKDDSLMIKNEFLDNYSLAKPPTAHVKISHRFNYLYKSR